MEPDKSTYQIYRCERKPEGREKLQGLLDLLAFTDASNLTHLSLSVVP